MRHAGTAAVLFNRLPAGWALGAPMLGGGWHHGWHQILVGLPTWHARQPCSHWPHSTPIRKLWGGQAVGKGAGHLLLQEHYAIRFMHLPLPCPSPALHKQMATTQSSQRCLHHATASSIASACSSSVDVGAGGGVPRQPVLNVLRLSRFPIYHQLLLEEALLRDTSRPENWMIVNDGAFAPAIVMGVSG
jgi:hypothetical protein